MYPCTEKKALPGTVPAPDRCKADQCTPKVNSFFLPAGWEQVFSLVFGTFSLFRTKTIPAPASVRLKATVLVSQSQNTIFPENVAIHAAALLAYRFRIATLRSSLYRLPHQLGHRPTEVNVSKFNHYSTLFSCYLYLSDTFTNIILRLAIIWLAKPCLDKSESHQLDHTPLAWRTIGICVENINLSSNCSLCHFPHHFSHIERMTIT